MVVFALTLVIFLALVSLARVTRALPAKELRRRARTGKSSSDLTLYKIASYGPSLDVFLWIFGAADFTFLMLASADIERCLVAAVIFLTAGMIWFKRPAHQPSKLTLAVAKIMAYPANWLLSPLHPIFMRLASLLRLKATRGHTGAYEKEDLLEIITSQGRQADNRISEVDLKTTVGALTFGDKSVASIMTPRRKIKVVALNDTIGPHLMDELHASGFSRFPVVKDSAKTADLQIVGTLYLHDLVGHSETGKVKDVMSQKVYFINESQTLREALGAILKTRHHLLVVVNNFEEIVGVISLEDIVEQILGEPIADEFDRYGDLRAVAGKEAKKEHIVHKEIAAPKSEVIK